MSSNSQTQFQRVFPEQEELLRTPFGIRKPPASGPIKTADWVEDSEAPTVEGPTVEEPPTKQTPANSTPPEDITPPSRGTDIPTVVKQPQTQPPNPAKPEGFLARLIRFIKNGFGWQD
ncbi:MAG: hypothetical protein AB4050_00640 [Synechococcus sp.]